MINLYNINCMDFMQDIPDKYYDLAIVDPPYGIGDFRNSKSKHKKIKWNNNIPNDRYFNKLLRISKNQIIWGVNYYNCNKFRGGRIIHNKANGLKNPKDISDADIAYQSFNNLIKILNYTWKGNVHGNKIVWDKVKIHPCEKPVFLYKWILKNYAKPGYKIFDSHGGSGSICIACHDMGFDLDWCELDKDYFDAAKKRYEKHISQLRMF